MILYKSTRGDKIRYTFSEILLKGIADDGGLFIPEKLPVFSSDQLKSLLNSSYQEQALFVFKLFKTGLTDRRIGQIINKAYSNNFDHPKIAPLLHLKDNQYILELWHGPTLAFKDMALQIKSQLFTVALNDENKKRIKSDRQKINYLILVATSGDTGKAALEGYKDLDNIKIIVLYPKDGVSKIQELSMATQEGKNVKVFGVRGNFDDIQKTVKEIFNDSGLKHLLYSKYNYILSSANSINWGRILPQIVYHIHGYIELINRGVIKNGEKIDIAVPTGNFGNILAAFYAQKMGLPIRKLICASNENNVLTEVLKTGVYNIKNRKLHKTPSPSMDILAASNFERLLFELTNDAGLVKKWMGQLKIQGQFTVDSRLKKEFKEIFYSDWVSNGKCLENIKKVFGQYHYLMDPHTSVVQKVVEEYLRHSDKKTPVVICGTAHFAKFPSAVYQALTGEISLLDEFKNLQLISETTKIKNIPKMIRELNHKKIIHKDVIRNKKKDIEKMILDYIQLSYNV